MTLQSIARGHTSYHPLRTDEALASAGAPSGRPAPDGHDHGHAAPAPGPLPTTGGGAVLTSLGMLLLGTGGLAAGARRELRRR